MANANRFPLVRGRTMRVTKTDGCCGPEFGDGNSLVTEGFVSVALSANITDAEEITVTNANGKTCVRDVGSPTFDGYDVEMSFCEVQPCLFSMITGQPVVTDANGNIIGFKMNSGITLDSSGFALEVWMGVPGVACEADSGAAGYLLLPCLQGGVIGDFSIENAAITFSITGASTKDGNGWGFGPYADATLPSALDGDDHLYVVFTTDAIPEETDGCTALIPIGMSLAVTDPGVTLAVPTGNGDCYDNELTIDWGDGTPEVITAGTASVPHTYVTNGTYQIIVQDTAQTCNPVTFEVIITGGTPAMGGAPPMSGNMTASKPSTSTRKTASKSSEEAPAEDK